MTEYQIIRDSLKSGDSLYIKKIGGSYFRDARCDTIKKITKRQITLIGGNVFNRKTGRSSDEEILFRHIHWVK